MRHYFNYITIFTLTIIFFVISCTDQTNTRKVDRNNHKIIKSPDTTKNQIGKVIFYLENSGSMFGYVNGFTEYVDVVSNLAEKLEFIEFNTSREFYFINGGEKIVVNNIGKDPSILKDKLNVKGFNSGDISKSNLNSMFQLALSQAKKDTITILISDGIYDIGKPQAPKNALITEGRETRSRFYKRLIEGNLQTIIIKLSSDFNGNYFPVSGGSIYLSQKRPFYIWIFGRTELLNEYFTDEYINSLNGYSNMARFLKLDTIETPYQITTKNKIGRFKFNVKNKNILSNAKSDKHRKEFQVSFAVDYSQLPFSESYFTSLSNYTFNNSNFAIREISTIRNVRLYGLTFKPTHLITVGTDNSPYGKLEISLKNNVPNWIGKTNIDNENNIYGDTTHTYGFKFLMDGITEAYQYKNQENNQEKNATTFKFEIKK